MALKDRVLERFRQILPGDSSSSSPEPKVIDVSVIEEQDVTSQLPQLLERVRVKLGRAAADKLSDAEVQTIAQPAKNPQKIQALFRKFVDTAQSTDIPKVLEKLPGMQRGPLQEIWPKIQAMAQMIRDPEAAWASKAMAIGALVYLISPLDVIPDIIPITGLTDDAALIVSVISTLALELGPYLEKSVQKSMKEGVAVAEELADIEVRKHNRIVRATLVGSICAAVLAIAVKFTLSQIG